MFICQIDLDYGSKDKLALFSPEDKVEFARRFRDWKDVFKEDGSIGYVYGRHIADNDDVQWLVDRDLVVSIHRLKGLTGIGGVTIRSPERLKELETGNIHIHVPNTALTSYDEINLIEDACTYAIQDELNAGWRIIAVCPPNSTRRPDYILGRSKPRD